LVLAATSGGIDVTELGGSDWRSAFRASNPNSPQWFIDDHQDLSARLEEVRAPVLLLWGDTDPISPVAVGERLASLLVTSELVVVNGGTHDLIVERTPEVLPAIQRFIAKLGSLRQD
jgi:pimeloyl-ACP methyl ester carboxylesterase